MSSARLLRKVAARIADGDASRARVASTTEGVRPAAGSARFFVERRAERTSAPGVATGLAVTGAGGDVLFIEATAMDGEPGLTVTGQLGDVMKESAEIALIVRARRHRELLGIDARGAGAAIPRPRPGRRGARRTGRRPGSR